MEPLVKDWPFINKDVLGPLRFPVYPFKMLRFGSLALKSSKDICNYFQGEPAKSLFAGLAAHSILPLDKCLTAGFGLVLGILGHAVGWPLPRGGLKT